MVQQLTAPSCRLLTLDNGEHLSNPTTVAFLAQLLQSAQKLTLLVTSRIALQLREEWVYPVGGLPFPPTAQEKDADQYAAVQLFEASARRVSPSFSLAAEWAAVVEICRLVEGVPLAVELAAGWRHLLPCLAIADEIKRTITLCARTGYITCMSWYASTRLSSSRRSRSQRPSRRMIATASTTSGSSPSAPPR